MSCRDLGAMNQVAGDHEVCTVFIFLVQYVIMYVRSIVYLRETSPASNDARVPP